MKLWPARQGIRNPAHPMHCPANALSVSFYLQKTPHQTCWRHSHLPALPTYLRHLHTRTCSYFINCCIFTFHSKQTCSCIRARPSKRLGLLGCRSKPGVLGAYMYHFLNVQYVRSLPFWVQKFGKGDVVIKELSRTEAVQNMLRYTGFIFTTRIITYLSCMYLTAISNCTRYVTTSFSSKCFFCASTRLISMLRSPFCWGNTTSTVVLGRNSQLTDSGACNI